MTTEIQDQTINFEGKDYKLSELDEKQLSLVNHCVDIERKIAAMQFQAQQLQVTQNTFIQLLRDALTASKEQEEITDAAISP